MKHGAPVLRGTPFLHDCARRMRRPSGSSPATKVCGGAWSWLGDNEERQSNFELDGGEILARRQGAGAKNGSS
jgi:hypothetical protein